MIPINQPFFLFNRWDSLQAWLVRVASEGAGGRAREPFVEHCFPPCVKQKYRESRPLGSKNKRALCSHKQHCTSTYDIPKKKKSIWHPLLCLCHMPPFCHNHELKLN
uniref:Uncharacterized protein n=1 Tax=Cacopsylla melanoneura TaxID=428564 RepID=A0A8D8QSI1_9HEMI